MVKTYRNDYVTSGHSPVDIDGSLIPPPLLLLVPLPVNGDCARANEINPTVLINANAINACTVKFNNIFCKIVHRFCCDDDFIRCCFAFSLRLPDSVVAI